MDFMRLKNLFMVIACGVFGMVGESWARPAFPVPEESVLSHTHNVALGFHRHNPDSTLTSGLNVGLFCDADTLRGVQIGLVSGLTRREMRGVNIGLLMASSRGKSYGVQIGTLMGSVNGSMRGVQLSGVSNIAKQANGLQIAGLTNACTSPMRGVQLSGITNIAMGVKRGVQISLAANVCSSYMRGVQAAVYNYADTLNGWQIGFFNVCSTHPRGIQLGFINYSRDTTASHKIGLVNINPRTRIDFMAFGGNSSKMNMAVRFRNRSTYNIFGMGTHYLGFDEDFSGAVFYRLGQYFTLSDKLTLSGDMGYFHVETFQKNSSEKPQRLFSLQARVNADYQFGRVLGGFASVGFGDTRYYRRAREYRHKMIFEMGLTMRLQRK